MNKKLVRVWDRNYTLRGQQFVAWNKGTFTIPADDPMAVELWHNSEVRHQITVESTSEMGWWVERMDLAKDGTLIVTCTPHVDVLRKCTIPDWKLVEDWLEAEKQWKSRQQCSLTDRLAAVMMNAAAEPGWTFKDLAAAVVADLLTNAPDEPAWDWQTR